MKVYTYILCSSHWGIFTAIYEYRKEVIKVQIATLYAEGNVKRNLSSGIVYTTAFDFDLAAALYKHIKGSI